MNMECYMYDDKLIGTACIHQIKVSEQERNIISNDTAPN